MKKLFALAILGLLYFNSQAQIYESEELDEPEESEDIFEIWDVSQKASFPGGDDSLWQFIAQNLQYPQLAKDSSIEGRVMLQFVVDTFGQVVEVEHLGAKNGFGLEQEAMRVLKLTSGMWTPAMQREKKVRMRFRVPIKFTLY